MKHAILQREETGDQGTFGTLTFYNGSHTAGSVKTGELPWRNNARGRSCIPSGSYTSRLRSSPKFGWHFILTGPGVVDVPVSDPKVRDFVLIHKGNRCGDRSMNFVSDVDGCIIVGMTHGLLKGQKAVLSSGVALEKLFTWAEGKAFDLKIHDVPGMRWVMPE